LTQTLPTRFSEEPVRVVEAIEVRLVTALRIAEEAAQGDSNRAALRVL
jgi:hypothetical protein